MTERMNIRRMQMLEAEKDRERPFDASRDLRDADWQMMRGRLAQMYEDSTWGGSHEAKDYAELASCLKILNPSEQIKLKKQGKLYSSLSIEMRRHQKDKQYSAFLDIAGSMKIIDPSFSCRMNKADREAISNLWCPNPGQEELRLIYTLADAHVFYPEGRREWSPGEWEHIHTLWDEYDGKLHDAGWLAMLRIACPEYFIAPSGRDWTQWRARLDEYRVMSTTSAINKKWFITQFAQIAAEMRILAAENVRVDERGLHVEGQVGGGSVEQVPTKQPAASEI